MTDGNETAAYANCSICSNLAAQEAATQKYGWEENDTYLPAEAYKLTTVRDLKPNSNRQ